MSGPSRVEGVRLLLRQRADYAPAPKIAANGSRPGPASFGWIACEHCEGDGCKRCFWRGWFIGDPYVNERIFASRNADASDVPWDQLLNRVVRCSSCAGVDSLDCSRCHGSGVEGALLGGKADLTGLQRAVSDSAERFEREADMLTHPAQKALSAALVMLRRQDPVGRRLVALVYELEVELGQCLPADAQVALLRAMLTITQSMPDPFPKLPSEVWAAWQSSRDALRRDVAQATANGKGSNGDKRQREKRNRELRREYEAGGYSMRALGRRYSLTHRSVSIILGA